MADLMDRLQQALASRYTLERELGRGGMAVVFLATDLKHTRPVALKVLRPELGDLLGRERFLREIVIAAQLQHPHIVPLYDSGAVDGFLYYTMAPVDGETLGARLEREVSLPVPEALRITRQVAEALEHAHVHDVVHRDVKPENIYLSGEHVLVADFGIARAISEAGGTSLTSRGIAIGTPEYMSPEQASAAERIDGRSDQYSLACVLYKMLAGDPPFTGRTAAAVLARHIHESPPSLRVVRTTVPIRVQEAIERALAKVPADRYPTVIAFATALEQAMRRRFWTRRRVNAAVGAAVAAAGLVGAIVLVQPADALEAHRVIVVPMDVRGGGSLSGEDAATALVNALNTTDSLIASVAEPGVPGAPSTWPDTLLVRLGRTRHARYLVSGRLALGAPIRIDLEVRDLGNGSVLFREVTAPSGSDPFTIARRMARAILPDIIRPGGAIVDEGLLSPNVPALAAYLEGERAYRDGDYVRADSLLGLAVERDSSFAWAALRGAQAASWLTERARAAAFLGVALRKVDSLPPRYAALAMGLDAYGRSQPDSAVMHLRAALALDHRWAEAHMALGEVYHHYVPRRGYLFSAAEAAFDSALIYDPGFAAPLFHAIQFAVWGGDRTRADSLWRRYSAIAGGGGGPHDQLALMRGCLDGSATRERWSEAASQSEATTVQAVTWLVVGGLRLPDCARAGLDVVVAREASDWTWHYHASVELAFVHAALGNVAEVRRLLGELGRSAGIVAILLATSGLPIADLADSALEELRQIPDSATTPRQLWAEGTWLIERGDTGSAVALLGRLARFEAGPDARSARLLRASLLARLTLQRGDTTAAIAALRRLSPTGDQATLRWSPWEVLPWERLHLAQLLAARGRPREAAEVASEFDSPASFGYLPWLPASLRLREVVERRMGDAPYANELHRRYLSLTKRNPL